MRAVYKREKLKLDSDFLKCCLNYNLLPKFLYYKTALFNYHSTKLYKQCKLSMLIFEHRRKEFHIIKRDRLIDSLEKTILNLLQSNKILFNKWKIILNRAIKHKR